MKFKNIIIRFFVLIFIDGLLLIILLFLQHIQSNNIIRIFIAFTGLLYTVFIGYVTISDWYTFELQIKKDYNEKTNNIDRRRS